jgi:holliday junction DNA helicase RuvA
MIAFLDGLLDHADPFLLLINVQGVGYAVHVPLSTSTRVGASGTRVRLLTCMVVREDSHSLYGFLTARERDAFIALTEKVSGVGPKTALNILSRLSVESLQGAIATGNVSLLSQCPGIGKKTAERLILELRDAFPAILGASDGAPGALTAPGGRPSGLEEDAVAALVTLGFKQPDAARKVTKVIAEHGGGLSAGELIKRALNS